MTKKPTQLSTQERLYTQGELLDWILAELRASGRFDVGRFLDAKGRRWMWDLWGPLRMGAPYGKRDPYYSHKNP